MSFKKASFVWLVISIICTVVISFSAFIWTERLNTGDENDNTQSDTHIIVDNDVQGFSGDNVEMTGECIPNELLGFIKEIDGFVVIFSGQMHECHELQEVTDFEVHSLNDHVQKALQKGIPFSSRADLPQIMDGLFSTD